MSKKEDYFIKLIGWTEKEYNQFITKTDNINVNWRLISEVEKNE